MVFADAGLVGFRTAPSASLTTRYFAVEHNTQTPLGSHRLVCKTTIRLLAQFIAPNAKRNTHSAKPAASETTPDFHSC